MFNEDKLRKSAALISLTFSVIILAIKFYAYSVTESSAVLSDALESIVNVITAIVALAVVHYGSLPADEEHPYGHGKLEYFSAAFEGGLIFFAAFAISIEAIHSLISGSQVHKIESGLIIVTVASALNLILGIFLLTVGKTKKSVALTASGYHVLSDVWTSVGVMVGLVLVWWTGMQWIDPVIAILVAFQLGFIGVRIVRKSSGGLLDEKDTGTLKEFCEILKKHRVSGMIDIHQLKLIRSGRFHHIDAHIVVPEFWNVAYSHDKTVEFEQLITKDYPYDAEIAFHVDPCARVYCKYCDLKECAIRRNPFEKYKEITVEKIVTPPDENLP